MRIFADRLEFDDMPDFTAEKNFAVFTNPSNKKLVSELELAGAKVFEFAPLEAEEVSPDEVDFEAVKGLLNFDWLIFPDVWTVDFFLQLLEANETDLFELDALRFCAFSEAAADRLRFVQLHTDVIPNKIDAENVLESLENYIGADNLANLKFLILKEKTYCLELAEKLKSKKAEVAEFPVYQIKIADRSEVARIKTLFAGGVIDEFIFTAPTDFIQLRFLFGGATLNNIFSEIKVSAADGSLYQMLREHDFKGAGLYQSGKIAKVEK